jgi:hypothetical protein
MNGPLLNVVVRVNTPAIRVAVGGVTVSSLWRRWVDVAPRMWRRGVEALKQKWQPQAEPRRPDWR